MTAVFDPTQLVLRATYRAQQAALRLPLIAFGQATTYVAAVVGLR